MTFQVICLKNRLFWNKVLTSFACFALVVTIMAMAFPISHNNQESITEIAHNAINSTTTSTTVQDNQ